MPSLDDITRQRTSLDLAEVDWLYMLVADWQILADLSFADLVLWVPDAESRGYWAGAQIRPTTGPTSLTDDVVGNFLPTGRRGMLDAAFDTGDIDRDAEPEWHDGVHVRLETIPVRRGNKVLAVVVRRTNLSGIRTPSNLESAYLRTSEALVSMINAGRFPVPGMRSDLADSLRVGDGFVRTDIAGVVTYASPNALSAYRRFGLVGELVGNKFATTTRQLLPARQGRAADAVPRSVLNGKAMEETELENDAASLLMRAIPLEEGGVRSGAVILLRDVTELRLRERELVSKEATIREIHHRVKNNLQTVAALLRLQSRRMDNPEARTALEEAVQRVGSIALVHETLSQSFDETVEFDDIADRLLRNVLEVAVNGGQITSQRIGSFGVLTGEVATPLAMVLTELIQNAAEHAFGAGGGQLTLAVNRIRTVLRMRLSDNGRGLSEDFDPTGSLGLSIVSTLVESELGGTLRFEQRASGGTTVHIELTL